MAAAGGGKLLFGLQNDTIATVTVWLEQIATKNRHPTKTTVKDKRHHLKRSIDKFVDERLVDPNHGLTNLTTDIINDCILPFEDYALYVEGDAPANQAIVVMLGFMHMCYFYFNNCMRRQGERKKFFEAARYRMFSAMRAYNELTKETAFYVDEKMDLIEWLEQVPVANRLSFLLVFTWNLWDEWVRAMQRAVRSDDRISRQHNIYAFLKNTATLQHMMLTDQAAVFARVRELPNAAFTHVDPF